MEMAMMRNIAQKLPAEKTHVCLSRYKLKMQVVKSILPPARCLTRKAWFLKAT